MIPADMLVFGNNAANDPYTLRCKESGAKIHPARFPSALPEFFIRLITSDDDIVVDPFAGSNTTGAVAESLRRRWLAIDNVESYLESSRFRFSEGDYLRISSIYLVGKRSARVEKSRTRRLFGYSYRDQFSARRTLRHQ